MNIVKKLGSIILMLALLLSLSSPVSVSAAADNSITIYKYDFTGITTNSTVATGDVMDSTTVVGTDTSGNDVTLGELIVLSDVKFTITKVEYTDATGDGDTKNILNYTAVTGTDAYTSTLTTGTDGKTEFENLENGIYLVHEETAANGEYTSLISDFIVQLPMSITVDDGAGGETTKNLKDVYVYPKNTTPAPVITKDIKTNGQYENVVEWSLVSSVPNTIEKTTTKQEYVITDAITSPLLYNGSFTVSYGPENATDAQKVTLNTSDYTLTQPAVGSTGTLKFELTAAGFSTLYDVINASTGAIKPLYIYIEFSTKIDASAIDLTITDPITNKADVEYTNDYGYTYTKDEDEKDTGALGIQVIKKDGNDQTILLSGAQFELYVKDATTGDYKAVTDTSGAILTLTTDSDGEAILKGLAEGTYYLKETVAPTGYTIPSDPYFTVTVNTTNAAANTKLVTITILNTNSFTLPLTGGTGTLLFTIVGLVLILSAATVYIVSKKNKATTR